MILLGCLVVLLVAGLAERLALARARRHVPIRVHVNGTRGKSTVTRMVAAALREAGIPTLAKVTGTEPRLILPDGTEQAIHRRSPANIREQAWALRQARRHGARALVAECMAVRPDLQWSSERDILQSTHGVITNVRLDHTDVMGRSVEQIARSLANTVPRHGVLIAGDRRAAAILSERCAQERARLVVADERAPAAEGATGRFVDPVQADGAVDPRPVCLALARELGVDETTARRGMDKAAADPGAASRGTVVVAGRRVEWIDVTAANDPESTDLLISRWIGPDAADAPGRAVGTLCVYNHRDDRPERLAAFARLSAVFAVAQALVITGDRPAFALRHRVRRACRKPIIFVSPRRLSTALGRHLAARPDLTRVVYCGNIRGFVRPALAD